VENKMQSEVISVTHLTDSVFVLRLARNGLVFKAGQYIVLGFPGERIAREYSIYSAEQDEYIELLIREVDQGDMSRRLKQLSPGDKLEISGPFGFFVLTKQVIGADQPVVFVATGTGISPFRSMIRSYTGLDYTLLHGVRYRYEAYHRTAYDPARFILCLSGEDRLDYQGRVSDYLAEKQLDRNALYYLCGNSAMVDDVTDILEVNGILPDQIKTEIFF
jgi:ferredoxin/flavodoxin---NADP+ reductase